MLSALTTTVSRLRKLLPTGRLVHEGDGYRLSLDVQRDRLDVREFRDMAAAARRVRVADPAAAADLFQRSLDLWRDPELPDVPGTLGVRRLADRLRTERRDVVEALAEVRLALGHHARLSAELAELVAADPLNEQLWAAWLLALYRDGRKAAALEAFDDAQTVFLTEVGAEASLPLRAMRDRIAADAPDLLWSGEQTVQESRAIIAGSDVTVASPARVYDYLLGGDNNFEADRAAADAIMVAAPDLRENSRDNRMFLARAVRLLAERGIRQFLDIGAGLPTQQSVHEVAGAVDPDVRVVYVDHDPVVVAHGRAVIDDSRNTAYVPGDLRSPAEIFADPRTRRLIDPAEPTAVLMLQVLHFIPADEAHLVLEQYRSWMAPGSALVIAQVTRDGSDPRATKAMQDAAERSSIHMFQRSRPEIEAMFAGLDLLAPLDAPGDWLAAERTPERRLRFLAGVGILPAGH